jgi:hypothetical protein
MKDYREQYTFTKISSEGGRAVSSNNIQFEEVYLDDIIQNFESFLRGCGFHFKGNLQIVSDDEIL